MRRNFEDDAGHNIPVKFQQKTTLLSKIKQIVKA